ncbi:MAG TPA: NAD(P)-binding domain-containing protein [Nitrososphaeraceae archaeon]|nr:NAD(P)-binding domain-containing protein [Nitrososphaeraceae archaeon]
MSDMSLIRENKVLVIGLGQLGLPVAKFVKANGFDVYGYDIKKEAVVMAEQIHGIKVTESFKDFDIYIICISTHKANDIYSPQIDSLFSIVSRISVEGKIGALVSIESTVPKGTSRRIFELLGHRFHVVHAPHRWYSLEEEKYGVNQLRVIGGVNPCCLKAGLDFYTGTVDNNLPSQEKRCLSSRYEIYNEMDFSLRRDLLDSESNKYEENAAENLIYSKDGLHIKMHPVSSIEIAELTKIIENSHRYLQIAFAEELYLYCQATGVHFSELRDALNTKWNVEILEPRDGIGGHCLPKDTKMFLNSSPKMKSKLLQSAMEVDVMYRDYRELRRELQAKKIVSHI